MAASDNLQIWPAKLLFDADEVLVLSIYYKQFQINNRVIENIYFELLDAHPNYFT